MSTLATKHFSGDIEASYTDVFEHFLSVYENNNPNDDNTAETVSVMTLLGMP